MKNSLQLVTALLTTQARGSDVPAVREQLLEAARRVATIGAVHERLYRDGSGEEADAAAYLAVSQSVGAMHLRHAAAEQPCQRCGGTGSNRYVGPPRRVQDRKGIPCGCRHVRIAKHGDDAGHLKLGRGQGEQDGQRVVNARVGINDHGDAVFRHAHPATLGTGRSQPCATASANTAWAASHSTGEPSAMRCVSRRSRASSTA